MSLLTDFDSELKRLGDLSWLASTLASDAANGDGVLPPSIKPLVAGSRAVGFATTVRIDRDDNRDLPVTIETGPVAGRMLVAGGGGDSVRAALGGITGFQMVQSGFAAFITDGLVRDRAELEKLPLGVWSRGATPAASRKEGPGGRPGSVLNVTLPGGIDLTQKPWCGTIIGSGLSAAVQQFLLAAYTFNQKATAIEADCGCHSASWQIFSQSALAEINASDEYARSVAAIAFDGQAKADANAFVAAFHSRNAILRQGLATGSFAGWHSFDAQRAPFEDARGAALDRLRGDLGIPPGLCAYVMA